MPVEIDAGNGNPVQVEIDGFEQMNPDQQQQAVAQVAQQLHAGGASAPSSAPAAAPAQSGPDTSFGSALRYSAHSALSGLGATAQVIGNDIGSDALTGAGKWAQGAIAAPKNYQPAGRDVASSVGSGDWKGAITSLPRAAVEGSADVAATIAAGALAGPAGAAGYVAARNFGDNAEARAANNGNATPDASDQLAAAGTTAAQTAVQLAGVGLIPGSGELMAATPTLLKPALGALQEGAAGAAADTAGQLGNSVGTAKGAQFDPTEAAAAGIQAGAAKGVGDAVGAARSGVQAATTGVMSRLVDQPTSTDQAASITRVGQMFDAARQQIGPKAADTAVLNNVKTEITANLNGYLRDLRKAGAISPEDFQDVRSLINDQALRHNNSIAQSGDGAPNTLFDQISDLSLPQEALQPLLNGVRDLDTVSTQSFSKNTTGPFQQLGGAVAKVATPLALLAAHQPLAALGTAAGYKPVSALGGQIGRAVDNVMGTSIPPVLLQRIAAQRALQKAGADAGPNTIQALQNARGGVQDAVAQRAGTQPDPQAAAAADDSVELMRRVAAAQALKQQQVAAIQKQAMQQNTQQQANIDASNTAQGQAQDQQQAQRDSTVDAYLNGKLSGPDASPPVGSQTAAEIAGWQQMLANARAKAALTQKQGDLYAKAGASDVQSLAQNAVDAQSRRNAVKLAMAGKTPTGRPDVSDAAVAAAVGQALRGASRVTGDAQMGGEAADRIAVGLPAVDPVPVNTPISGLTGQPMVSPQVPASAPAVRPATAPSHAPAALTGPTPMQTYVTNGLMADHGMAVTPEHIETALDTLVANGQMPPQQAAMLRTYTGPVHPATLSAIKRTIADTRRTSGPGTAPNGVDAAGRPITNPIAYRATADAYHAQARDLAASADAAGLPPEVGNTVRAIAAEKAPAAKIALRDALLNSLPTQLRQLASRYVPDHLVKHGAK